MRGPVRDHRPVQRLICRPFKENFVNRSTVGWVGFISWIAILGGLIFGADWLISRMNCSLGSASRLRK
jgi:hypothetical protein